MDEAGWKVAGFEWMNSELTKAGGEAGGKTYPFVSFRILWGFGRGRDGRDGRITDWRFCFDFKEPDGGYWGGGGASRAMLGF